VSKDRILLDIQEGRIRCAQIKHSLGSWGITAVRDISGLLSPDIIRSLLDDMGIRSPKNVVVIINGRDASVKLMPLEIHNLSQRKPDEIDGVISNQLPEYLPMKVEQTYYDYQIMKSDNYGTTVLVVAMKRNVLNGYIDILSSAGIYPEIITISPVALFNAIVASEPNSMGDGKVGLIHLHDHSGDIAIVEDGIMKYGRSFNLQADKGKENVIREITNSLATHLRTNVGQYDDINGMMDTIHLVVEGDELPMGLTEDDLTEMVPGARWLIHSDMDKLIPGMALINRTKPLIEINLYRQVRHEERAAKQMAARIKLHRRFPAIATAFLFIAALILGWQDLNTREKLQSMDGMIRVSKMQLEEISSLNRTEGELLEKAMSLNWVTKDYPMLSYRFYRIAGAIPDSVRLKEMYIPEVQQSKKKKQEELRSISTLHVVGYAREQSQIESFLDNLRNCDCFTDAKQEMLSETLLSGERLLEFNIRLSSNGEK
jgi:hypothetical protein